MIICIGTYAGMRVYLHVWVQVYFRMNWSPLPTFPSQVATHLRRRARGWLWLRETQIVLVEVWRKLALVVRVAWDRPGVGGNRVTGTGRSSVPRRD